MTRWFRMLKEKMKTKEEAELNTFLSSFLSDIAEATPTGMLIDEDEEIDVLL